MPNDLNYPDPDFQADSSTHFRWLGTRKSSFQAGMISLPGLFQTSNLAFTNLGFLLVIVLELYGLYWLLLLGVNVGVVLAAFALDIAAAIFAHKPQETITLCRNYNILHGDANKIAFRDKLIGRKKTVQFIFFTIIIILAIMKIAGFYLLYVEGPLMIPITVSYILVAFLHVYNSGFFIWEYLTRWRLSKAKSKFAGNDRIESEANTISFYRDYNHNPDDFRKYSIGDIVNIQLTEDNKRIKMDYHGLLTDSKLKTIVSHYNYNKEIQQNIVALCLEAQLNNFTDPFSNVSQTNLTQNQSGN